MQRSTEIKYVLFLINVVFLFPFSINAQEFKHNSNYVYGMGMGKTIEEADAKALVALASFFKVHVNAQIEISTSQKNNKKAVSQFSKQCSTKTMMDLQESIQWIDDKTYKRKYIVYRYINKKEYIDKRQSIVKDAMTKIKEIEGTQCYHKLNLLLGYYYKAYKAIDTDIMDAIMLDNEDIKKDFKSKAEFLYTHSSRFGSIRLSERIEKKGFWARVSRYKNMSGFQYYSEDKDEWMIPSKFEDNEYRMVRDWSIPNQQVSRAFCNHVLGRTPIRFTYEFINADGKLAIYNVPEEWYFIERNFFKN